MDSFTPELVTADMTITKGITSESFEQLNCSRNEKEVGFKTKAGIQP